MKGNFAMGKIDCTKCKNITNGPDCKHGFRMASNAGGAAVDCTEDVWFCTDYDEEDGDGEYDD